MLQFYCSPGMHSSASKNLPQILAVFYRAPKTLKFTFYPISEQNLYFAFLKKKKNHMYVINGFKDNLISREQQIHRTCGFA